MDELDKLRKGLPFDCLDAEISGLHYKARCTVKHAANASIVDRQKLYRNLFKSVGSDTFFNDIGKVDYGLNITIGKNSFINDGVQFFDSAAVVIGDYVQVSTNVLFVCSSHDENMPNVIAGQPIFIGNHCRIGAGSTILGGVVIGDNVTIGAGSVITKSISSGATVVGHDRVISANKCLVCGTNNLDHRATKCQACFSESKKVVIYIEGEEYDSYKTASEALGIPKSTVRKRVLSHTNKFKEWTRNRKTNT